MTKLTTKTVNLFVYGTLMPGGYNDAFGLAEACEEYRDAVAFGEMYNRSGDNPVYPVVNFDGLNEISGVVFIGIPENHEGLQHAHAMELGAGYEKRDIIVTLAWGRELEAIAYHFDTERRKPGALIESGSWRTFCREAGEDEY